VKLGVELDNLKPEAFKRLVDLLNAHGGRSPRLYPYQVESGWTAIKSILNKEALEVFWCYSRQSGKTELAASTVVFLALAPAMVRGEWFSDRGLALAIFGAKEEQAHFIFDRVSEMVRTGFIEEYFPGVKVRVKAKIIYITKNQDGQQFKSIIWRSTASGSAKIEGHTLDAAFIDEAQDTPDERLKKSIGPMMSTTRGTRVYLGSFTDENFGYFMRQVIDLDRLGGVDGRRILYKKDWTYPARYNPDYKQYVEEEINTYGIDDPYIQTQYCLNFEVESSVRFVSDPERFLEMQRGPIAARSDEQVVAGIDPARERDFSVVTVVRVRDNRILSWLEMQGTSYDEQELEIRKFLAPFNPAVICIEENNAGIALYDYLNKDCRLPGYPNFSGRCMTFFSSHKNKAALYMRILKLINEKGLSYPKGEDRRIQHFVKQFLELQKTYRNNVMRVDHPKGRDSHNDYPDSFAMALAAAEKVTLYSSFSKFAANGETEERYVPSRPQRHFSRQKAKSNHGVLA